MILCTAQQIIDDVTRNGRGVKLQTALRASILDIMKDGKVRSTRQIIEEFSDDIDRDRIKQAINTMLRKGNLCIHDIKKCNGIRQYFYMVAEELPSIQISDIKQQTWFSTLF